MYLSTGVVWKISTGTWKKFTVLVFAWTIDKSEKHYMKAWTLSRFGVKRLTYDCSSKYWII